MTLTFPSISKTIGCLVLLGSALCMIGCQQAKPKAEPPPSIDQVAELKASIEKADPGALVGDVIYTLSDRPYTAVDNVDIGQVKVGQIVSFVDAGGNPINNGTVVAIMGDNAHVRFDSRGKRPPQKGDVAVWLKG